MTTCSGLGYKPSDLEMADNDNHSSGEETKVQAGGVSQIAMMQSLLQQQQTFFLEQQVAQRKILKNLIERQRGDGGLLKGAQGAHEKARRDLAKTKPSKPTLKS